MLYSGDLVKESCSFQKLIVCIKFCFLVYQVQGLHSELSVPYCFYIRAAKQLQVCFMFVVVHLHISIHMMQLCIHGERPCACVFVYI